MVECQRRSLTPKSSRLTRLGICFATAAPKQTWTASLRLEGAQISPAFQHQDLCKEHAEQFAAVHKLRFPPSDRPSAPASKLERPRGIGPCGRVLLTPKR